MYSISPIPSNHSKSSDEEPLSKFLLTTLVIKEILKNEKQL